MIGRAAQIWIARYSQAVVAGALIPAILFGALPRFGCGCGGRTHSCCHGALPCNAQGAESSDAVACCCSHRSSVSTAGVPCYGSTKPNGKIPAVDDGRVEVSTSETDCRCNCANRGHFVQVNARGPAELKSKGKQEPLLYSPLPVSLATSQHLPRIGVDYHPPAIDRVIVLQHLTI